MPPALPNWQRQHGELSADKPASDRTVKQVSRVVGGAKDGAVGRSRPIMYLRSWPAAAYSRRRRYHGRLPDAASTDHNAHHEYRRRGPAHGDRGADSPTRYSQFELARCNIARSASAPVESSSRSEKWSRCSMGIESVNRFRQVRSPPEFIHACQSSAMFGETALVLHRP